VLLDHLKEREGRERKGESYLRETKTERRARGERKEEGAASEEGRTEMKGRTIVLQETQRRLEGTRECPLEPSSPSLSHLPLS
jgi:hypothetical protein